MKKIIVPVLGLMFGFMLVFPASSQAEMANMARVDHAFSYVGVSQAVKAPFQMLGFILKGGKTDEARNTSEVTARGIYGKASTDWEAATLTPDL